MAYGVPSFLKRDGDALLFDQDGILEYYLMMKDNLFFMYQKFILIERMQRLKENM